MSTTAEELYSEGRYFGREEGVQTGLCRAAYALRKLRAQGATIADACLHLDSLAGMDKPSGPDAKAVPAAVNETLASIAKITGKGGASGALGNPGDIADRTIEIMRARRAGTYEPGEAVEQLTDDEAAAQTIELLKARRGGQ